MKAPAKSAVPKRDRAITLYNYFAPCYHKSISTINKKGDINMVTKQAEQNYSDIYRDAFPKLVTYLQKCGIRNRQDAEDMAAKALHILWEKWDTLETHTYPGILCWLLQTAKNLMKDETKKKTRRPETVSLEEITDSQLPQDTFDPFPHQTEAEYTRYLNEILRRLSEKDAALLRAKIVEQLDDAVIAEQLGISRNTLRVRWMRVRQKIRLMWDSLTLTVPD
jgi:RNA polymerase sigma factor (sigma-70 family)